MPSLFGFIMLEYSGTRVGLVGLNYDSITVGERNNGEEEEDQFVSGLKVQNDAKVQTDGCKVAEEAQDEGGLEDVTRLSDNDDDETILARDNLRNFRANQIGVASSSARAAIIFSNVDVGVQDEDDGETQSDDEVSYISTSNEEDEEVDHVEGLKKGKVLDKDQLLFFFFFPPFFFPAGLLFFLSSRCSRTKKKRGTRHQPLRNR
ncbi:hypothetical protein SLEP1_g57197 [Rubroshorea leprosula]|uniref:Uncharacterized protein n=1 Tax=Rubroshorea leprosula TaxID=152421 RepID=A0AAV5MLT4_9ROSI|nr:hypothetical protein SLEP1_g57197 [Rubroshorea leprosula]